jgi:hypothetical protein
MNWSGSIHLGASWAAFRGRTASNSAHAHTGMQLTRELPATEVGNIPNSLAGLIDTQKPLAQCIEGLLKASESSVSPLGSRIEVALVRLRHDLRKMFGVTPGTLEGIF